MLQQKPIQTISPCFLKNLSAKDLMQKLNQYQNDEIYFYVLTTLKWVNEEIIQQGCGPNLEGDLITLCTCKHYLRTFPDIRPNTWIAGLTSLNLSKKIRFPSLLFYLTRISHVYDTHAELWNNLTKKQRGIKSASVNVLGDIYQPKSASINFDGLNSKNYEAPIPKHVHEPFYSNDINPGYKKTTKLIQGDFDLSFAWNKPKITWKGNPVGKGQRKLILRDFIAQLGDY